MTPTGIAYIDNEYVPISEAKISILDWGFLHSDATYDVAHVWKGRFFRLDKHVERFANSAKRLHLTLPVSHDALMQILAECVSQSGLEDAYVEMILTRGVSPTFSRDPRDAANQLICFAVPFGWILPPDRFETGLSVTVSDIQRIPPESVDPKIKNYHWLDFVMGLYEAYDRGTTSVILQDNSGNLTEGPGFNVFVVKDRSIATPARGVLEGITRQSTLEIATEIGLHIEERAVSIAELMASDEAFATSTAGGVMPITQVNGSAVADGKPGSITRQLSEIYWSKHRDPVWSQSVQDLLS